VKRHFFLFCLVLFISSAQILFSQESFVPLNGGEPITHREISESVYVDGPEGECILYTIEEGQLYAYVSYDEGNNFEFYPISAPNSQLHNLESLPSLYGSSYISFISDNNDRQTIQIYQVEKSGDIILRNELLLCENKQEELISVEWLESASETDILLFHTSNKLSYALFQGLYSESNVEVLKYIESETSESSLDYSFQYNKAIVTYIEKSPTGNVLNSWTLEEGFSHKLENLYLGETIEIVGSYRDINDFPVIVLYDDGNLFQKILNGQEWENFEINSSLQIEEIIEYKFINGKYDSFFFFYTKNQIYFYRINSEHMWILEYKIKQEYNDLKQTFLVLSKTKNSFVYINDHLENNLFGYSFFCKTVDSWDIKPLYLTAIEGEVTDIELKTCEMGSDILVVNTQNENNIQEISFWRDPTFGYVSIQNQVRNNKSVNNLSSKINIENIHVSRDIEESLTRSNFNYGNIIDKITNDSLDNIIRGITSEGIVWTSIEQNGLNVFYYSFIDKEIHQIVDRLEIEVDEFDIQVSSQGIIWKYNKTENPRDGFKILFYSFSDRDSYLITDSTSPFYHSVLSEDGIVWEDRVSGKWGLYYYSFSDNQKYKIDDSGSQDYLQISSKAITWTRYDGNDWELFYYSFSEKETLPITNNETTDYHFKALSNGVFWIEDDDVDTAYYYSFSDKNTYKIISKEHLTLYNFEIFSEGVVYSETYGDYNDLLYYSFFDKTIYPLAERSSNSYWILQSTSDGICWCERDGDSNYIYYYSLLENTSILIADSRVNGENLNILPNGIGWIGFDGHDFEVYFYSFQKGEITNITNNEVIDKEIKTTSDGIIWNSRVDNKDYEIRFYSFSDNTIYPITSNNINEKNIHFSNEGITWNEFDGNDDEIYYYTFLDFISPTMPLIISDPPLGSLTNDYVRLTPSATDEGSGIDYYQFSTNGGSSWSDSTGSDLFFTNMSIWYQAIDNAGNKSGSTKYTITNIDTVPPIYKVNATVDKNQYTWMSNITPNIFLEKTENIDLEVQVSDDRVLQESILYITEPNGNVINATWTNNEIGKLAILNLSSIDMDGDYTIHLELADSAGNTSSFNKIIRVDNTPPTINLNILTSGVIDGQWTNKKEVVIDVGVGPNTPLQADLDFSSLQYFIKDKRFDILYQINLENFIPVPDNRKIILTITNEPPFVQPLTRTVVVKMQDVLGNWGESEVTIMQDCTAPTADLEIDWEGFTWSSNAFEKEKWMNLEDFNINASIDDDVVIDSYSLSVQSPTGDFSAFTWNESTGEAKYIDPYNFNSEREGFYEVVLSVVDLGGNTTEIIRTVKVDHTPPVIDADILNNSVETNSWTNIDDIYVDAIYSDVGNGSGVNSETLQYSIDGGPFTALPSGETLVLPNEDGQRVVRFRIWDNAGNDAVSSSDFVIWQDYTKPDLSYNPGLTAQKEAGGSSYYLPISINIASDKTSQLASGFHYQFDSGTIMDSSDSIDSISSIVLPSSVNTDGTHRINIGISDNAGNTRWVEEDFILDTVAPELQNLGVYEDSNNSYISTKVSYRISDKIPNNNLDIYFDVSEEAGIEYFTSDVLVSDFSIIDEFLTEQENFGQNEVLTADPVWISQSFELVETTFLYYRFTDLSNNRSDWNYLSLDINNASPFAPVISSLDFNQAVSNEDTRSINEGEFQMGLHPSDTSMIDHFEYQLIKGDYDSLLSASFDEAEWKDAESRVISSSEILGDPSGEFPDNELSEFYGLAVRGVNTSEMAGEVGLFIFRVDTQPPANLRIENISASNVYNREEFTPFWQAPTDLSGISHYYYGLSYEAVNGFETAKVEDERYLSSLTMGDPIDESQLTNLEGVDSPWQETTDLEFTFKASDIHGTGDDVDSGLVYVYLCAEDVVGWRQYYKIPYSFDLVDPYLESFDPNEESFFTLTYSEVDKKTTLDWNDPVDNWERVPGSGDYGIQQEISITQQVTDGSGQSSLVNLFSSETGFKNWGESLYNLYDLDVDSIYCLNVKLTDIAGNSPANYSYYFYPDGEEVNVNDIVRSIYLEDNGFLVSGEANQDNSVVSASLRASGLELKEDITPADSQGEKQYLTAFYSDSQIFNGNEPHQLDSLVFNDDRKFLFQQQGFLYTAYGGVEYHPWNDGLSPQPGFLSSNLSTVVELHDPASASSSNDDPVTVDFTDARLINETGNLWSPVLSMELAASWQLFGPVESTTQSFWKMGNVRQFQLDADGLNIVGGQLLTDELFGCEILNQENNQAYLPLNSLALSGQGEWQSVSLEPFTVVLGESTISVESAILEQDRIFVQDSELELTNAMGVLGSENGSKLQNYYIYPDGKIEKAESFYFERFSFTDALGNVVTVNSLIFEDNQLLGTGTMVVAGTGETVSFVSLIIDSDDTEIDDADMRVRKSINTLVYGYTLQTDVNDDVFWTPDGYLFSQATLIMTSAWNNQELLLSDVGISLNASGTSGTIWKTGSSTNRFTVSGSSYGSDLVYNGFILDNEALKAVSLMIDTPAGLLIDGMNRGLLFENVVLNSDGTITPVSTSTPLASVDNTYAGFIIQNAEVLFDGEEIIFNELSLLSPAEISPSIMTFYDHRVNASNITKAGEPEIRYSLNKGSFQLSLSNMSLGEDKITADGVLDLPGYWGDGSMTVSGLGILNRASQDVDLSLAEGQAIIGGWVTRLSNAEITAEGLIIHHAEIDVHQDFSIKTLEFTDVILGSDGRWLGCNDTEGSRDDNFTDGGGFLVKPDIYRLTPMGVRMEGNVSAPSSMISGSSSDFLFESKDNGDESYLMMPGNGFIRSAGISPVFSVPLKSGQLGLEAQSVRFDKGLMILDQAVFTSLSFNGGSVLTDFPIGETGVNSYGEVVYSEPSNASNNLNIFSQIEVSATQFQFTNEGLVMVGDLAIPSLLGSSNRIYFDNLTFTQDGGFYSTSRLDHLKVNLDSSTWDIYGVTLSPEGLDIASMLVDVPTVSDQSFIFRDIFINSSGDMGIRSIDTPELPIADTGMKAYLTHAVYEDACFTFGGGVRLPDTLPGDLSGLLLNLEEMKINITTGELLLLKADINDQLGYSPAEGWRMAVQNPYIDYVSSSGTFLLGIESASLAFPASFGLGKATVNGLTYDFNSGDLTFTDATLTDVHKTINPVDFTFDQLTLYNDFSFELTGNATIQDNASVPADLRGLSLTISSFQVRSNGSIEEIVATLAQQPGSTKEFFEGKVAMSNTSMTVEYVDNEFIFAAGTASQGVSFELADDFPQGIAGSEMSGYIRYNVSQNKLLAFDADYATTDEVSFIGNTKLDYLNLAIDMKEGESTFGIEASAGLIMPSNDSVPTLIRGATVPIDFSFINTDMTLDVGFVPDQTGPSRLINNDVDLFITDLNLHLQYIYENNDYLLSIGMAGDITFGEDFPSALQSTTFEIDEFEVTSNGDVSLDVTATITDQELFSGLYLMKGSVGFQYTSGWQISLGGDLKLQNSNLPGVLNGITAEGMKISINQNGELTDFQGSFGNISGEIYTGLRLENGSISFMEVSGTSGFVFDISGTLMLSNSLKSRLAGIESLSINTLVINTSSGVTAFSASMGGSVTIPLFTGVEADITMLEVGSNGFSTEGSLHFSDNGVYPEDLVKMNAAITVGIGINWNGEFTKIEAGLEGTYRFGYGGFSLEFTDIEFNMSGVYFSSVFLKLPSSIGGNRVGMKDVSFDTNGHFHGRLAVDEIVISNLGGFRLVFNEPNFVPENSEISASTILLETPDMMGNQRFAIHGFKLNNKGIYVGGADFELPSFETPGGIEFSLRGSFIFDDGSNSYFVEAEGTALLPGMGGMHAIASFTNISSTYPIGLKRAYFEYTLIPPGLALGSTGMFITAFRGGLAFGPPVEVPMPYRNAFNQNRGTRLQVGISMTLTDPKVWSGTADMWIDVENFAMAMQGNAVFMEGKIDSSFGAAINPSLFYANVRVRIAIVEGKAELWIWKDGRYVKFSGLAEVRVCIPKGFVAKIPWVKWKRWRWRRSTIYIPGSNWWTPYLGGVQFGYFTNNQVGFKTYVKVPAFGQAGVYASTSGRVKIGNVSSYEISRPAGFRSIETNSLRYSTRGSVSLNTGDSVIYEDKFSKDDLINNFMFTVPGSHTEASTSTRASGSETIEVKKVERIICVLVYDEGNPVMTAQSALGGTIYSSEDGDTEMFYDQNVAAMIITNPKEGDWIFNVDGLEEGSDFAIQVLGKTDNAKVLINSPSRNSEISRGSYTIKGEAYAYSGEQGKLRLMLVDDPDTLAGYTVAEDLIIANGEFEVDIDTTGFLDGEYNVVAFWDDGSGMEVRQVSEGTIQVDNSRNSLLPMEDFFVSYFDDEHAEISFSDPNGMRLERYEMEITHGDEIKTFDCGLISRFRYPVKDDGEPYLFRVYGYNERSESPWTSQARYVHQVVSSDYNQIGVSEDSINIQLEIGKPLELELSYFVDNLRETGSALDYMSVLVEEAPEGLSIMTDRDYYSINESEGKALLTLGAYPYYEADDDGVNVYTEPVPGEYNAIIRLSNRGDQTNYQDVTLYISQVYPAVEITEVEPAEWHIDDDVELAVRGNDFVSGVRFYMDDQEITPEAASHQEALFTIPAGLEGGLHQIRALMPDGKEASYEVEVLEPGYMLSVLKSYDILNPMGFEEGNASEEVRQGNSVNFYYSIIGFNRFEGSASLSVDNPYPQYFDVDLKNPILEMEEVGELEVFVSEETPVGNYEIYLEQEKGDPAVLNIFVSETDPLPSINGFNPLFTYPGKEISILGSHFGSETGKVLFQDVELEILSWSNSCIDVVAPFGSSSDDVWVYPADETLEPVNSFMVVRNSGYNIYLEEDRLKLQQGETQTINVMVRGSELPVSLQVDSELDCELSQSSIIPNGSVELRLSAPFGLENGTYEVTITGESEIAVKTRTLVVDFGSPYSLQEEPLPQGRMNQYYSWDFQAENGIGDSRFELEEGTLPPGLILKSSGSLSGIPVSTGTYNFTLTATDQQGRSSQGRFVIVITEEAWSGQDKDGGANRFMNSQGPVDIEAEWEKTGFSSAESMLSGGQRVFVKMDEGIRVFNEINGLVVYQLTGDFTDYYYRSGRLLTLDRDGNFSVQESEYGNFIWGREKVDRFYTAGTEVYLWSDGKVMVLDLLETHDDLAGIVKTSWAEGTGDYSLFEYGNQLGRWYDERVEILNNEEWTLLFELQEPLTELVVAEDRLILLDESGTLWNGSETGLIEESYRPNPDSQIIRFNGYTVSSSDEGLSLWSEDQEVFYRSGSFTKPLLLKDKFYSLSSDGLVAYNIYHGDEIFHQDGDFIDMIFNNGQLLTLEDDKVTAWAGPVNVDAPMVEIVLYPSEPQGDNGYFNVPVEMQLNAKDRELDIKSIEYQMLGEDWLSYDEPLMLPEGSYGISAHSIDAGYFYSLDDHMNVWVDYTAPVTEISFSTIPSYGKWYSEEVSFSLEAVDNYSGVSAIEYRLDNGLWSEYSEPVTISDSGMHTLEYRSKDIAGNLEESTLIEVPLDLEAPVVELDKVEYPEGVILYLSAIDAGSGVDRIEYYINNGEVKNYAEPLALLEKGSYELSFRAVDKSGRSSAWKRETVEVDEPSKHQIIRDLRFPSHFQQVYVKENLQVGDYLFAGIPSRANRFGALPEEVKGSYYLMPFFKHYPVGGVFYSFTAGTDMDVYQILSGNKTPGESGWELLDDRVNLRSPFYRHMGRLYHKEYNKGDKVIVHSNSSRFGWDLPPLVFAQPKENITPLLLIEPRKGQELHPFEEITLTGYWDALGPDEEILWKYRIDQGEWVELDIPSLSIPYVEDLGSLDLQLLRLSNTDVVQKLTETFTIKNRSEIQVAGPVPGGQYRTGEVLPFEAQATCFDGVQSLTTKWYIEIQGEWTALDSSPVINDAGLYRVKVQAEPGNGYVLEEERKIYIAEQLQPLTILFGQNGGDERSMGEPFQIHESGRAFGFSQNLDYCLNWYPNYFSHYNHRSSRIKGILLREAENFRVAVSDGLYRVEVETGPPGYYRHNSLYINGERANITDYRHNSPHFRIVRELEVVNGEIKIEGTKDLPLLGLVITPIEEITEDLRVEQDHRNSHSRGGRR